MSSKTVANGQTIFRDNVNPHAHNMFKLLIVIGLLLAAVFAVLAVIDPNGTKVGFCLIGIVMAVGSLYPIGCSDIVFDENTKTIFIIKRRWYYKSYSQFPPIGSFDDFVNASVRQQGPDSEPAFDIQLRFADGFRERGDHNFGEARDDKEQVAKEINEWWVTTTYYAANQQRQGQSGQTVQTVQVVVQPAAGGAGGGTQIVYGNAGDAAAPAAGPAVAQPVVQQDVQSQ